MNGIKLVEKDNNFMFVYAGRFDFHEDTVRHFREGQKTETDICHRVSFKLMADALINAINFYLANVETTHNINALAGETMHYVRGIISAVAANFPGNVDWEINLRNMFEEENPYKIYLSIMEEMLQGDKDKTIVLLCIESCLNHILDLMNNEISNLKRGDRSTNRSIGSGFDAFDKLTTCLEGFILGQDDSMVMTMLVEATKGSGSNFDQSGVFTYTSEESGITTFFSSINALNDDQKIEVPQRVFYYNYLKDTFDELESKPI